jgi:hypothetical protein
MRIRSWLGTLALAAAALGGPTLLSNASHTQILGLPCDSWIFVGDVCKAIEYCWETEDPACGQASNQPSTAPRQQPGY